MTTRKRVIRQRLWSGDAGSEAGGGGDSDKANARSVGESLRNVDSAVLSTPPIRMVTFNNQTYTSDGLVFSQVSMPFGVVMALAETVDGKIKTTALTGLKFSNGTATATFGLTPGERYATIRLLVIG